MISTGTAVPDLLRRFAPTPHHTRICLNDIEIELYTNDAEIVSKVQPRTSALPGAKARTSLVLKIIRDHDAPQDDSTVTVLSAPPLTTLMVGTGTLLVLDGLRGVILGFLASSISAERFVDELLPILLDRLKRVGSTESP